MPYLQAGSRKPDLRLYDAVLAALLENAARISQLVVVTPVAGGSGTGIFGRAGGASGGRLSALEQAVVDSGRPYLIVRAAPSDRVTDRYGEEANLVVAGFGGLPSGLQASRSQVREHRHVMRHWCIPLVFPRLVSQLHNDGACGSNCCVRGTC